MAECDNCGAFVTDQYRRVFARRDAPEGKVLVCPRCTDKIRDVDGHVRDARGLRRVEQHHQ